MYRNALINNETISWYGPTGKRYRRDKFDHKIVRLIDAKGYTKCNVEKHPSKINIGTYIFEYAKRFGVSPIHVYRNLRELDKKFTIKSISPDNILLSPPNLVNEGFDFGRLDFQLILKKDLCHQILVFGGKVFRHDYEAKHMHIYKCNDCNNKHVGVCLGRVKSPYVRSFYKFDLVEAFVQVDSMLRQAKLSNGMDISVFLSKCGRCGSFTINKSKICDECNF